MSKMGKDLLRVRKRLGLNRDRMAALVGCSPDSIRNYEMGRSKPSALAAGRLVEFMESLAAAAAAPGEASALESGAQEKFNQEEKQS